MIPVTETAARRIEWKAEHQRAADALKKRVAADARALDGRLTQVGTFEDDLEALRLLINPLRKREDFVRMKAEAVLINKRRR